MNRILGLLTAAALILAGADSCSKSSDEDNPDQPVIPGEKVEVEYEYTDIDTENYVYPEPDAKINPNIVKFDPAKDRVESLDTERKKAVLTFASMPKLYRGVIIPVEYEDSVYALFVLSCQVSGNTATIEYRDAAITEMFFNQTISIGKQIAVKSTDRDYDGKFMSALKLLSMVDTGFQFVLDTVDVNFDDTDFDLTFGEAKIFEGKSINCPFKRLKAILAGKCKTTGHFSINPSFSATKGWQKDLKQSVVRIFKIVPVGEIPVLIDFNIDICGDLNITSKIGTSFNYYQNVEGTLEVSVGAEYDFETGSMTPHNKLEFKFEKKKPDVSKISNEASIALDAAVFPRFKIYFYKFKYAGFGADLKPIYAKLEYSATRIDGHVFDDFTFSIGSRLKAFVYVWDWTKDCNKYLAETPEADNLIYSWKSPFGIEDKTADRVERMNYGGESQCSLNVTDIAYGWDEQTMVPPAADEMSVEVEGFSTLPDPAINPECYDESKGMTKTLGGGWYSCGKKYFRLDSKGDVDVPFRIEAPAGEKYKLVARILDGKGNPVMEVEHPTRNGIKAYKAVQRMSSSGLTADFEITVDEWGAVVNEKGTLEGIYNDVTFRNGTVSGTMIVDGKSYPSNTFLGCGLYHTKNTPYGYASSERVTITESLDHARWASEKLGISTGGTRFYNTEWNGMQATRCYVPDGGGTWTYVGNFVAEVEGGDVRVSTISFRNLEEGN